MNLLDKRELRVVCTYLTDHNSNEVNFLKSNLKRKLTPIKGSPAKLTKKKKIQFGFVTEFEFPRAQGFVSVPSHGGSTLGMAKVHIREKHYSIDDYEKRKCKMYDFVHQNYPQLLPTYKRRALLKAAGVRKIDIDEKNECGFIRLSRLNCGCDCLNICDPEECSCYKNGVVCQVDRYQFPCACTQQNCNNSFGRIEFNLNETRKHFKKTIHRLSLKEYTK